MHRFAVAINILPDSSRSTGNAPGSGIPGTEDPTTRGDHRTHPGGEFRRVRQAVTPASSPHRTTRRRGSGEPTRANSLSGAQGTCRSGQFRRVQRGRQPRCHRVVGPDGADLASRHGRNSSAELKGHTGRVNDVEFSKDGKLIVTASWDQTARIWRADTGDPIAKCVKGHTGEVNSAAFSADGQLRRDRIGRQDGADLANRHGRSHRRAQGTHGRRQYGRVQRDGRPVVTASSDGTARIWRTGTGEPSSPSSRGTGRVNSAAFSADGKRVVTASVDKTARIWRADRAPSSPSSRDTPSGSLLPRSARTALESSPHRVTIRRGSGEATRAPASPSSRDTGPGQFGRVQRGRQAHRHRIGRQDGADLAQSNREALSPSSRAIRSGSIRPRSANDGSRVVTASADKTARIWRERNRRPVAELKGHTGGSFRPRSARTAARRHRIEGQDGADLASRHGRLGRRAQGTHRRGQFGRVQQGWPARRHRIVGRDGADLASRQRQALIAVLKGHTGGVNSAAFSEDGQPVVTASIDQTARIWRADTGALVAELKGHTAASMPPRSAERHHVVTASDDGRRGSGEPNGRPRRRTQGTHGPGNVPPRSAWTGLAS